MCAKLLNYIANLDEESDEALAVFCWLMLATIVLSLAAVGAVTVYHKITGVPL